MDEKVNYSATAWFQKGVSLDKLGRNKEALECYNKAIELNPENATYWHMKGLSLNRLERYEEAIFCFDKTLALNPNDKAVWYAKGLALKRLKRFENAIKCFDKTIELEAIGSDAYAKEQQLTSLDQCTKRKRLPDEIYSEIKKFFSSFSEIREPDDDSPIDFRCCLTALNPENGENSNLCCAIVAMGFDHGGYYVDLDKTENGELRISSWELTFWLEYGAPVFLVAYDEKIGQIYWQCIEDDREKLIQELEKRPYCVDISLYRLRRFAAGDEDHQFAQKVFSTSLACNTIRPPQWTCRALPEELLQKKNEARPPPSRAFSRPRLSALILSPRIEVLTEALDNSGVEADVFIIREGVQKMFADHGRTQTRCGGWWRSKTLSAGKFSVVSIIEIDGKKYFDTDEADLLFADVVVRLGPVWKRMDKDQLKDYNCLSKSRKNSKQKLSVQRYEEGSKILIVSTSDG